MPATLDLRRGQVVGDASRRAINLNTVTHAEANAAYAPIASPTFTGDPKAPTPAPGDNDTSVATTAFVGAAITAAPNKTITLSGDVSGSGTAAIPTVLATVNANVGTWNNVTLNAKGLATAGSNVGYLTSSGVSGMTAGQLAVAATATTITSSIPYGTTGNNTIVETTAGGTLAAGVMPAHTGDVTSPAGSTVNTLATVTVAKGGTNKTSWTAGSVAFAGAGGTALAEDNANFFWDGVNHRLGIGTAAPVYKFESRANPAAGDVCSAFRTGPNGADTTSYMLNFTDYGGTIGIGGVTRNGTNTVAYATSSDERLKENISDSRIGLEELMSLRVCDYTWKAGGEQQHGLIAQQVAPVYPAAVHVGGEDPASEPWMIDYGRLTPLLIKSIQQQQKLIENLEQRLALMEAA
jgi:hypothetical protein